jgi:CDP-glucose 4,6-dehydratase
LQAAFDIPSVRIILVITTDKVYRNDDKGTRFVESDTLEGKDPYSASKVAAEAACVAWQQISRVEGSPKIKIARAGNVIGGGDFAKNRLIPDLIRSFILKDVATIRNPKATRPWQHVLDPLIGYLKFIEYSLSDNPQVNVLNFGPIEPSLEVCRVLEIVENTFKGKIVSNFDANHEVVESLRLDLDSTKAINLLGWKPKWRQEEAIVKTIEWWNEVLFEKKPAIEMCQRDIKIALGLA